MIEQHMLGFFTRGQVATIFSVGTTTIRRWEIRKKDPLPHIIDEHGWRRFPRDPILARADKAGAVGNLRGGIGAEAFQGFKEGLGWRDIVMKMKLPPKQAEELFNIFWADNPEHNEAARAAIERAEQEKAAILEKVQDARNVQKAKLREPAHGAPTADEWKRQNDEQQRQIRENEERVQREWEEKRAKKREGSSESRSREAVKEEPAPPAANGYASLATLLLSQLKKSG